MFPTRDPKQTLEREARSPAARQVRLDCRDADEVAQVLGYLGAEIIQLGRGPFRGIIHLVQLGPVVALRISFNRAIHARGYRPNTYGFELFTPGDRALKVQGRSFRPRQISVVGPPGEWDHTASAPYAEHLVMTVDAESLRRSAEILHDIDLGERLRSFCRLRPDPAAFGDLAALLRRLFDQVGSQPALLDQPDHCKQLERQCIETLLRTVFSGDLAPKEPRRMASQAGVIRRALEFMLTRLDRTLYAEDVCQEVGISERSLRYAFQDQFGVGPMTYFKLRKLAAMRRELKLAAAGTVAVHEIARRWGFRHTGNIAADYRRQFGELPSETRG